MVRRKATHGRFVKGNTAWKGAAGGDKGGNMGDQAVGAQRRSRDHGRRRRGQKAVQASQTSETASRKLAGLLHLNLLPTRSGAVPE
eukprot:scaffold187382_cov19-Tisochrysis_lutea.AAC.1